MARFFGKVGYGHSRETVPEVSGIWRDVITEREYFGDVLSNDRTLIDGDKVNNDISVSVSISIISDDFADENIFAIRYVTWRGSLWLVSKAKPVEHRIILTLGGVYNGPKVGASPDPSGTDA